MYSIRWVFILARLINKIRSLGINNETTSPIYWYWDGNGELGVAINHGFNLFNLDAEEIEQFATASGSVDLWVARALGARLGLRIPFIDKVYYELLRYLK
jgi:hypothetical protein